MAPPPVVHTNWHVRALTVPGPDTGLSIFVSFDNVRYLFGCGEGTQRAFVQKRLSTRGLAGIFLPDGRAGGRNGLPGMIMTACDVGIKKLDIIGPSDTTHHIATHRASLYRSGIQINMHPHPPLSSPDQPEDIYSGMHFTVKSIALPPSPNAEAGPSRPSPISPARRQEIAEQHLGTMFPAGESSGRPNLWAYQPTPSEEDVEMQMVYICQAPPVPGKFDNKKASAMKVPNGPIRAKLVRGEDIEFNDPDNPGQKKVVKSADVVGGGSDGAMMIVVNTSEATLPSLLSSTAFDSYRERFEASIEREIGLVVHRVPMAVWQDPTYHDWMKSFGPNTQHLVATTDHYRNDAVFNSTAWNLLQLSLLDNEVFPLVMASTPTSPDVSCLPPNASLLLPNHYLAMQPRGQLEAQKSRDLPYPATMDEAHAARRDLVKTMPEYALECHKARSAVRSDPRWESPPRQPGDDITITTLGTGSAIPSKHRNVSGTHLDVPGVGGFLLDCGEGTLGQLRRRYGAEGLKQVYKDLRMVFVSHMHADHHLGLQAILEDRLKHGATSKLYLVAPIAIAISMSELASWSHRASEQALDNVIWVDSAALQNSPLPGQSPGYRSDGEASIEDAARNVDAVPVARYYTEGSRRWPKLDIFSSVYRRKATHDAVAALQSDLGLIGIRAPRVNHRGQAWGLVLHHDSGWKIAYSGDTMPCESLIRAGRDATLLIHEATLEDDKPDVAAEKGHSTFSQAIEVGKRMGASHILLNHFSQRYPKIPKSKVSQKDGDDTVVSISYDLMSLKVGDMWRMSYYMDAAEVLLSMDGEEDDDVDVVDAVKKDVNPTVNGKDKAGKKEKGKKQGGGTRFEGKRAGSPKENGEMKKARSSEEA